MNADMLNRGAEDRPSLSLSLFLLEGERPLRPPPTSGFATENITVDRTLVID